MSELVRHAFTILFARGFIRVAQFVSFLLIARYMTPDEFGWFGLLTTAMALAATLGSLGLRQSFTYEIGQKRLSVGEAAGTMFAILPLLVLASSALIFMLYGREISGIGSTEAGAIISVGVAGTLCLTLIQGINLGQGDINSFSVSETLPRVALMVFAVVLAVTASITLSSALWAHVVSLLLAVPIALFFALRRPSTLSIRLDKLPGLVGYGLVFALNLFLITLCSRLSMFLIENQNGTAAAGQFFAAIRINEIFLEAAAALGMVVFSQAARQSQAISVIERNARIACWIFWLFAAGAVGLALFAPLILELLLGPSYETAAPVLQILAFGLAPAAASKIIYSTIAGQGKPLFGTSVIVFSLLVNFVFALALIPALGVSGGAVALVVGQYLLFFGYVFMCRIAFNIPATDFLVPRKNDIRKMWTTASSKISRKSG